MDIFHQQQFKPGNADQDFEAVHWAERLYTLKIKVHLTVFCINAFDFVINKGIVLVRVSIAVIKHHD